jgi:hypothetical protein
MKSSSVTIFLFVALLTIGCGSGDESKAVDALTDAADSATATVEDAVDTATEAAEDDPMARCLKLAAEENWKDALEPCSEAAKANPDDLGIKHALEQATAAAKE